MSPSWHDRLHVCLTPGHVALVRLARGLTPRVADHAVIACPQPAIPADWAPALETLRQALAGRQWRRASARVVLSGHFVRSQLVDWDASLTDAESQRALLLYRFGQTWGEAAAGWDYRWSEAPPPASCLAAAIDPGLLAGLREAFADPGLHVPLSSVQPWLAAAFNRFRKDIDGRGDWLLLAEPGRLTLARFRDGEWVGLHSQQVGESWGVELPAILSRVQLVAGLAEVPGRLCVHAPGLPDSAFRLPEGWSGSVLRLPAVPGLPGDVEPALAMALAA